MKGIGGIEPIVALAATLALFFGLGFITGATAANEPAPYCPTEDSCYVDYQGGVWHVIEEPYDSAPWRQ